MVRFVVITLFAAGCGGRNPPEAAAEGAATGVTCALNCSGVEETATAPTEAEARAAVQARVGAVCDPDDGQYFITCGPRQVR